jgi:AcrR family transcriptional regulator
MTAQHIADAARKLLDEHGANGVTMRRVAAAVGITPMALYRHYANRDGLLNALADAGFDELAGRLTSLRLSGDVRRQFTQITDAFLDLAFEKPRLFELMFLSRRDGARRFPEDFRNRRSPTANVIADVVAGAMQAGALRQDDVWEIVFETGAFVEGLVMLYVGGRVDMRPEEFRALSHRALGRYLNGIRS